MRKCCFSSQRPREAAVVQVVGAVAGVVREVGLVGDVVALDPVVHALDERRVVAAAVAVGADSEAPLGIAHGFAMTCGELLVPVQAERCSEIELIPSLGGGRFKSLAQNGFRPQVAVCAQGRPSGCWTMVTIS